MYADDVKVYAEVNGEEPSHEIQAAINFIEKWATTWELPLAAEKSHCLVIQSKHQHNSPTYKLKDTDLKHVENTRDLGFHISSDLSFDSHYKAIVKKANYRIYNLFKQLKTNDSLALLRAYKTYIRPVLESGTSVFNPFKKKDIALLESVQNNFTRKLFLRCFGTNYDNIPRGPDRAKQLKLPCLRSRRKMIDMTMMFKILTNRISIDPTLFFGAPLTTNRRGNLRLYLPVPKSQARSNFLTYRNLKDLNLLLGEDENIINMSVSSFKSLMVRKKLC